MAALPIAISIGAVTAAGIFALRQKIQTGSLFGSRKWATDADMTGKYVVITGGSKGLGFEAARALANRGADVTIASRSREAAESAIISIEGEKSEKRGKVDYMELDLSSFESIRAFAKRLEGQNRPIDVLILNAGILSQNRGTTKEGIREIFGLNHVGHFYLTDLLLKQASLAPKARIVVMSSGMVEMSKWDAGDIENKGSRYMGLWGGNLAYSNSKLYNFYFTRELHRRLKSQGSGITVYAVDPGYCQSDLDSNMSGVMKPLMKVIRRLLAKPTTFGAQTAIHVASAPGIESTSGQFYVNTAPYWSKNKACHLEDAPRQLWDHTEKLINQKLKLASAAEK